MNLPKGYVLFEDWRAKLESDPVMATRIDAARVKLYDQIRSVGCFPSRRLRAAKARWLRAQRSSISDPE